MVVEGSSRGIVTGEPAPGLELASIAPQVAETTNRCTKAEKIGQSREAE